MASPIGDLVGRIRTLESQLEVELAARRADLKYRIETGRVIFEEDMARRHRALKSRLLPYILGVRPIVLITAPLIYALIVPLLLLDLLASVYHAICFPIYGIARVRRNDYLVFDRRHLGYLNAVEKINCAYCSYANGLIAYIREIASRTEQYWCPIKHAERIAGAHQRYVEFVDFGDGEAYRSRLEELRAQLGDQESKDK